MRFIQCKASQREFLGPFQDTVIVAETVCSWKSFKTVWDDICPESIAVRMADGTRLYVQGTFTEFTALMAAAQIEVMK